MRGPTRSVTMAWRLNRSSETIRSGLSAYFNSSLPTTNFQPRSGTAVRWYGSSRAEDEDEDLLSLHRKKCMFPSLLGLSPHSFAGAFGARNELGNETRML
jgi:hypothetical protein